MMLHLTQRRTAQCGKKKEERKKEGKVENVKRSDLHNVVCAFQKIHDFLSFWTWSIWAHARTHAGIEKKKEEARSSGCYTFVIYEALLFIYYCITLTLVAVNKIMLLKWGERRCWKGKYNSPCPVETPTSKSNRITFFKKLVYLRHATSCPCVRRVHVLLICAWSIELFFLLLSGYSKNNDGGKSSTVIWSMYINNLLIIANTGSAFLGNKKWFDHER